MTPLEMALLLAFIAAVLADCWMRRRLEVRKMRVAQLQPDTDCPGLWIGFRTAADRDTAMSWFAADDLQTGEAK